MKRYMFLLAAALLALSGCKEHKALLPNVSGKAGEIVVVMDKDGWDGDLGSAVRDQLTMDCPYLASREPMFSLVNVSPTGFADLFKVHRNILIFHIAEGVDSGLVYNWNVWARPQCIVQLNADSHEAALAAFDADKDKISAIFEQAERDRIVENSKQYEEVPLREPVQEVTGGYIHFPVGYRLRMAKKDFVWIADEKQYSQQIVYVYKFPAAETDNFTKDNLLAKRNEIMQRNVPGMFDNTWMTTSTYIEPTVEFISYKGRQMAQMRGFWEVHNDFMGGPFVSHAFYSQDNKEIIVVEGDVYAPRYDKRQYLRQVESILYSFEWAKSEEEEK